MEQQLKTAKLEYESNNFDAEAFKKRLFIRLNKQSSGVSSKAQRSTKDFFLGKKPWVVAAVAVIFLGVTFNQPVIAAIKATFWGNHAGVERAVENGYQQEVQGASVKFQGIETKVTNVVVDKSRLGLAINMKFDDISSIKDVDRVYLDLLITDGNGRVISGDGYPERLDGSLEGSTDIVNKDKGKLNYNVLIQSSSASIPQMSELKVQIKSILLFKKQVVSAFKKLEGPWNSSVALDKQFVNAEGVAYTSQSTSKDVNVISAEMLPTGFAVKFVVNTPVDENIWQKVYLVDSNGKSISGSGSFSMDRTADNKDFISMIFEVSSFEKINSFKFIVKDINGKDSEITLVRASK
ncbi:MAG TPA: DUF4179 domain-containing protein [Desulfosporosinus sp.]